jgi:glycerophosphoryl diester phosphodiesterase
MQILKKIGKITGFVVLGIVGLYLILFVISLILARPIKQQAWYQKQSGDHTPLILAHQGGEGEYPSNTKLAFTMANQAGADVLDTDMQMTKDGALVLAHDETLEGRTNGTGNLADKTYTELQQLNFAYKWSPDGGKTFPYRDANAQQVYSLNDLFTDFPSTRFGIEIKKTSTTAATKFCDTIKQFKYEDKVLVSSGTDENMRVFREACPTVATSATDSEATKFYIFQRIGLVGFYSPKFSSLQVPEKQGSITIMTKYFAGNAHKRGLKVYNWTIDTPEQTQHFVDLGADGVNTSYPKRIVDSLK